VGSVGDNIAVGDALDGVDAVIHCAGFIDVEESQREPELYMRVNCLEPLTLLDAMAEQGVERLVFSSTAAVYGEPTNVPIPEDAPANPINAYGVSKLAFEHAIAEHERVGLRAVRFRYFNVAGAMPDATLGEAHDPETHIIPRVLLGILQGRARFAVFGDDYPTKDGTCVRDYVHVCDLARAHRLAVEALLAGHEGGVLNLGNGNGYTNREVVEACSRVTGREVEVAIEARRPGDPAALVASSGKAASVLGWVPEYPGIDEMVAHAWAWHSAQAARVV
jgi:UDP-glucose 4-epimerase